MGEFSKRNDLIPLDLSGGNLLVRYLADEVSDLKRRYRNVTACFFILMLCFGFVSFLFIPRFYPYISSQFNNLELNDTDIDVYFSELDSSEIDIATNLVRQVNPIYTLGTINITFVKNMTAGYNGEQTEEGMALIGWNRGGEIYVLYKPDKIRETLCHELLHSFIPLTNNNHKIVYDMGAKEVCYK